MITRNYLYYKRLVFTSDGVGVAVVSRVIRGLTLYDSVKIKNQSRKQSEESESFHFLLTPLITPLLTI